MITETTKMSAPRASHCYTFFGVQCEVFTTEFVWPSYPWLFRVCGTDGNWIRFAGVPNQCETVRSAMMRAWWRCKWIAEGTFDQKYVSRV